MARSPQNSCPKRSWLLVCPVRPGSAGRAFSFDRGKDIPSVEKRKSPIESKRVRTGQLLKYRCIRIVIKEVVGIGNTETDCCAGRSSGTRIGSGKRLGGRRTVKVVGIWAGRKPGIATAQKIESVRAAVDKALIGGLALVGRDKISGVIDGI